MIAVQLTFPAGRCHATPWGRHVNEGAVEWPPAPWRILRALLAVWHHKCPDAPERQMRHLVTALTSPPSFSLPPASQGHTRHYMPIANNQRTKVFDTFITVDPQDPLVIIWPCVELDGTLCRFLDRLLGALSYFGRAESWVSASLLDAWEGKPNAIPAGGHTAPNSSCERVRLLAPVSDDEYNTWRAKALQGEVDRRLLHQRRKADDLGKDPNKLKLPQRELARIESGLPKTLFDALHSDTGELRKAGWNRPPGSRWVDYVRPADIFASRPRRSPRLHLSTKPTVARYAVCGNVRPRLTEAVWIGERVRTALMAKSRYIARGGGSGEDAHAAWVFSGKAEDGTHSRNGHTHAHFLPESSPHQWGGCISHLTVFARCGFGRDDQPALSRLRRVWAHGGHDLQFVPVGLGKPEDFGGTNDQAGESRILAESDVWISRTPFVPTDHLRVRPSETKDPLRRYEAMVRELRRIVRKEMERRPWLNEQLGLLEKIEPLLGRNQGGTTLGGHFTTWLKFRRERQRGNGHRGDSRGYGFRLRFSRPVRGPIILGYGCHFGLGQFWAAPKGN